jgi:hypothetical protein
MVSPYIINVVGRVRIHKFTSIQDQDYTQINQRGWRKENLPKKGEKNLPTKKQKRNKYSRNNKTSARIYRPRFRENSPKRWFSIIENERFGLVFSKTRSLNSDTVHGGHYIF